MEPTLYTNNILVTERITKRFNRFERGDIIVAKSPVRPQENICKRIIGLPGDKICIKPRINFNPFDNTKSIVSTEFEAADFSDDFEVQMDNKENSSQIDNQESAMRMFRSKVVHVPLGHVWIEGDNYENSADSRLYGPIPIGLIQSRVLGRIWPFSDLKLLA